MKNLKRLHSAFIIGLFFIVGLFAILQHQVSAETFPTIPILSPSNAAFTPPSTVSVTYYRLNPDGSKIKTGNKFTPCGFRKNQNNFDDAFGCTENSGGGYKWSYPYLTNPYSISIETNYLRRHYP